MKTVSRKKKMVKAKIPLNLNLLFAFVISTFYLRYN